MSRSEPVGARRLKDHPSALSGMLLALALLFAQAGAVVHAYAHHRSSAELLNTPVGSGEACQACCSFAPLLAAASGKHNSLHLLPSAAGTVCLAPATPLVALSPRHSFLSRGPPSFA